MSMTWRGDENQEAKPFLEHLEELRGTLIRCALALLAALLVAVPIAPRVLRWLRHPLDRMGTGPGLRVLEVAGAFSIAVQTILWTAVLVASPFLLFFILRFIFPGLKRPEQRTVIGALGFGLGLFLLGVCMGYFVTLPVALRVMYRMNLWLGTEVEFWTVVSYVAFSLRLLLAFGLAFEMPVLILALGHLGLVSAALLRSKRRYVIVILLVVAMILTPPDVFTQLIMALPLMVLYELCVWLLWIKEKRARTAE